MMMTLDEVVAFVNLYWGIPERQGLIRWRDDVKKIGYIKNDMFVIVGEGKTWGEALADAKVHIVSSTYLRMEKLE